MSPPPSAPPPQRRFWLGWVAARCYQRSHWVLLGWVLLAGLSLLGARRLSLESNLTALLPERFPSVQALAKLENRAGATGYIVVVAQGAPQPQLRSYAERVAARLEELPGVAYVDVRREQQWARDNALQFASIEQLESWAEQLEERVDWEIQRHNPLFFDLEEDREPPALDLAALEGELGSEGAEPNPESSSHQWLRHQASGEYYEDSDANMIAVLARPEPRISDLDFAAQVLDQVDATLNELRDSQLGPNFQVALTGRYKKQLDHKLQVQKDLGLSSLVALGLILLYLLWHFRRPAALLHLGLPLVLGLLLTFGVVGVTFGQLNLLTAFIGAILLGLGIDHGIHLLSAYQQALAHGHTPARAIEESFSLTGRAVAIAALTTLAGFLGLALSEFRTFREFGIVAALGMSAVVLAYGTCLPALLSLHAGRSRGALRNTRWMATLQQRRRALLYGSVALALLCWLPLPRLGFDYDFEALQDADLPSFELDRKVNQLLGYSQSPTLILTKGEQQEKEISEELRRKSEALGSSSTIDMVASISDLIGNGDARARQALIQRIGKAAKRIRPSWVEDEELKKDLKQLIRMTEQAPLIRSRLPESITRQFGLTENSQGLVLVFPAIRLSEGNRLLQFADQLNSVAGDIPVAGEAMVLADILETVKKESGWVLASTALGVFLALWLLSRSLRTAAIAMAAASCSLAMTLGVSAAFGLELNYLNMVAIPVLFGVAVDGAVHLLNVHDLGNSELSHALRSIWASLLTTSLGFGALLLADHPGLQSMGQLALIGLTTNALVSLVALPAWLAPPTELQEALPA